MHPGTLLQDTSRTASLLKALHWHNHNRKDFNLQALHCGKQLFKQAFSMQINQIFHTALRKTNSMHKARFRYKRLWCVERFSWGNERQHTDFSLVKRALHNMEVFCIDAPEETRTVATPLWSSTHFGKTDGAFNAPPWPALSTTA